MIENAHHALYVIFSNASRAHKNGRMFEFMKPSECGMGGVAIQLFRVLCLLEMLVYCIASKAFLLHQEILDVSDIVMKQGIGICIMW